jgi:thioredoxin-related protein
VKLHVKEQPQAFQRFGAQWTPTVIVLDPDGKERHRIEGFLPAEDFLAQLEIGLAKLEFAHQRFQDAEHRFRSVCDEHPKAKVAPEACYWAAVSKYKATNDAKALKEGGRLLHERYPQSEWAQKGSVWIS